MTDERTKAERELKPSILDAATDLGTLLAVAVTGYWLGWLAGGLVWLVTSLAGHSLAKRDWLEWCQLRRDERIRMQMEDRERAARQARLRAAGILDENNRVIR